MPVNVGRAAVLISGGGTNLQSLIDAIAAGDLAMRICVVVSNKPNAVGKSFGNTTRQTANEQLAISN